MPSLAQLTPLESLSLPGIGKLDCTGLILIVGPNSSGKSQLLRDIHQRVSGEPRSLVVASDIRVRRLPYEQLLDALVAEGYVRRFIDDNGTGHVWPLTTYVGTGQHAGLMQDNQIQTLYQAHNKAGNEPHRRRDDYLGYFGRFLVTALFLEQRLTALNQAGMIDFINSSPQHDLHALYLNDSARDQLFSEVRASFGKAVWPDTSRGTGVCLRVSDDDNIPTHQDRLSPLKMNNYRTIETEGDGLKSYVATCVALLLGRRPICIVDEPEMCLHPPQAYNLGQFIGLFGASREGATFVATHSSHVLRGVIQTAPKLQVVRLTRLGSAFRAHLVPPETLAQALAKPTVRAESVLDGIFAQAVAVVEADGDRTVYQAAWESLKRDTRLDIHFATVGGTGGIADTCALYSALRIPVAVVADLDILADSDRLERVLGSLGSSNSVSSIVSEAQRLVGLVKQIPPTISPTEARNKIMEALPADMDWCQGHDTSLRSRLQQVARKLDRMGRLKSNSPDPLPDAIRLPLDGLIQQLHSEGLFVVPVGELEGWLAGRGIRASKQNKWAWANEAASVIRDLGPQPDDIWQFMGQVGTYLQNRYSTLAG